MTSPLPEDIKSRLDSITAHKQRINEIGKRLTEIIQQTVAQLRESGMYSAVSMYVDEDPIRGAIAWHRTPKHDWQLVILTPREDDAVDQPFHWPDTLAVKASLSEKAAVVKHLPDLLAAIEEQAKADRENFEELVVGIDIKEGA